MSGLIAKFVGKKILGETLQNQFGTEASLFFPQACGLSASIREKTTSEFPFCALTLYVFFWTLLGSVL
jgi:hypothetical protein